MGIENLNNNFRKNNLNNFIKKNNEKPEDTTNKNLSINSDSLNSGTLGNKEGIKFDSDNMSDKETMLYAPKGKNKKPKSFADYQKEQWDLVGGVENYNGKDADLFGAGVFLTGAARWLYNKIFG